jgi:hypothetical protein
MIEDVKFRCYVPEVIKLRQIMYTMNFLNIDRLLLTYSLLTTIDTKIS